MSVLLPCHQAVSVRKLQSLQAARRREVAQQRTTAQEKRMLGKAGELMLKALKSWKRNFSWIREDFTEFLQPRKLLSCLKPEGKNNLTAVTVAERDGITGLCSLSNHLQLSLFKKKNMLSILMHTRIESDVSSI